MASPITLTRRWIISAYEAGQGTRQIAAIFGRCESGVRRVRQNHRERGTADPQLHLRGRKGKLTEQIKTQLTRYVADHPDATLAQIRNALGLEVSISTVDRWLKKLGLSLKKSLFTQPSRIDPTLPRGELPGGSV